MRALALTGVLWRASDVCEMHVNRTGLAPTCCAVEMSMAEGTVWSTALEACSFSVKPKLVVGVMSDLTLLS